MENSCSLTASSFVKVRPAGQSERVPFPLPASSQSERSCSLYTVDKASAVVSTLMQCGKPILAYGNSLTTSNDGRRIRKFVHFQHGINGHLPTRGPTPVVIPTAFPEDSQSMIDYTFVMSPQQRRDRSTVYAAQWNWAVFVPPGSVEIPWARGHVLPRNKPTEIRAPKRILRHTALRSRPV